MRTPAPPNPQPRTPVADQWNDTVLIIEDEKLIIVSTQMVLEAAGFRVESATNGEDGINKASRSRRRT